jgi:hypothetical protein
LTDSERHSVLTKAFTCILYATSVKDLKSHAINFTDLLVLCMAFYSAHSSSRTPANTFEKSLDLVQSVEQQDKFILKVDYRVIVDALYDTLTNDDNECWGIARRVIIHTIDLSEMIANNMNQKDPSAACDSMSVELLPYLIEKLSNLCFERSWWSKRAGLVFFRSLIIYYVLLTVERLKVLCNQSNRAKAGH